MTNSAPHDDRRPSLSEAKRAERHETTEHLPRGASGFTPSEGPRQDATGIDPNRRVSAPLHAPLADTAISHLRNAAQILVGIRTMGATLEGGDCTYHITAAELNGLSARIGAAIAQIEAERVSRPLMLRSTVDVPLLEAQLREMQKTVEELAEGPSGLIDVAASGIGR